MVSYPTNPILEIVAEKHVHQASIVCMVAPCPMAGQMSCLRRQAPHRKYCHFMLLVHLLLCSFAKARCDLVSVQIVALR